MVMFVRMETEVTRLKERLNSLERGEVDGPKTARQVIIADNDSEINVEGKSGDMQVDHGLKDICQNSNNRVGQFWLDV